MTYTKYLTCDELLSHYPHTKIWGWNASKIGIYYRCLLLDGHPFGTRKRLRISEQSFKDLMNYKSYIDMNMDFCSVFLTYDEIMEEIPQAIQYRWNPTVIGVLKNSGLLKGKKLKKESAKAITESSAISLIKYTNQRFINIRNM